MNLLHTAHVPAGSGPFPTVFLLHGWGASAHDLFGIAPLLNMHLGPIQVICPQGSIQVPIGPGMNGYGWFPLVPGQPPDPEAFVTGAEELETFFDAALSHYPVDRERVVVAGFSQGGAMSYDLALRRRNDFAGMVGLSTWLHPAVLDRKPESVDLDGFPVLVVHGTEDSMVDIQKARDSKTLLESTGVDLSYEEYSMGHELGEEALRKLLGWLGKALSRGRL